LLCPGCAESRTFDLLCPGCAESRRNSHVEDQRPLEHHEVVQWPAGPGEHRGRVQRWVCKAPSLLVRPV